MKERSDKKAYRIDGFIARNEEISFITRFGGQPDWISSPQWPVSPAWDNRPLKFIGQIRLNDFYKELRNLELAHIFLTQPDNAEDDFYDPDIIFPDEGENAVIIQPYGEVPEYVHVQEYRVGPTVDENIWVPQITEIEEALTDEFKDIDIDKFCGVPALLQNYEIQAHHSLLLQLHTRWLPFYVNAGGAPTLFAFLDKNLKTGFIIIEDI